MMHTTEDLAAVWTALRTIYDPEVGINIVDLGLVYDVELLDGAATVTMTLTTPGCPMHEIIVTAAEDMLRGLPGIRDAHIHLTWEPRWHPDMMTPDGRAALNL